MTLANLNMPVSPDQIGHTLGENLLVRNEICHTLFSARGSQSTHLESTHRGNRIVLKMKMKLSPVAKNIASILHDELREVGDGLGRLYCPENSESPVISSMAKQLAANDTSYRKNVSTIGKTVDALYGTGIRKGKPVAYKELAAAKAADDRPEITSLETLRDSVALKSDSLSPEQQQAVTEANNKIETSENQTEHLFPKFKEELFRQPTITLKNKAGTSVTVKNPLPPMVMQNVEEETTDYTTSVGVQFYLLKRLAGSDQNTMKGMEFYAVQAGYPFGDKENIMPSVVGMLRQTHLDQEPIVQDVLAKQQDVTAGKIASLFKTYKGFTGFMNRNPKMAGLSESLGLTSAGDFKAAKNRHALRLMKNEADVLGDCPIHHTVAAKPAITTTEDVPAEVAKWAAEMGCPHFQKKFNPAPA